MDQASLVSIKRTLTRLSLEKNPDINNEAVPAILLLSKLSFLSIFNTSIEMIALRRLAETIFEDNCIMDIVILFVCEAYIDNMDSQYLGFPLPPPSYHRSTSQRPTFFGCFETQS